MKIDVVDETHWREAMVRRTGSGSGDTRLASAVLKVMQSSGIGVPIDAAYDFTAWLGDRDRGKRLWRELFYSVFKELDLTSLGISMQAVQTALRNAPFEAVRLFLLPVTHRVLSKLGQNMLLSVHSGNGAVSDDAYRKYASDFDDKFLELINHQSQEEKDDQQEAKAWRESLGLALVQFARSPDDVVDDAMSHDVLGACLFLSALEPVIPQTRDKLPEFSVRIGTVRKSARYNSDGVTGIRHASPSEDPSMMVPSQLVYPFIFLTERIENEGFTAFDRPPPLPQKAQLLLVAFPINLKESPAVSVLRAAWWRACRQVEAALIQASVTLSFCWLSETRGRVGRDSIVRCPSFDDRFVSLSSHRNYLGSFPKVFAPFLAGTRPLSDFGNAVNPPQKRAPLETSLTDNDVILPIDKRNMLKLYLMSVRQGDASESDDLNDHIQALNPGTAARGHIRIAQGEKEGETWIIYDDEDPVVFSSAFEDRKAAVTSIQEKMIERMMQVHSHG